MCIHSATGGFWIGGRYVSSEVALIGIALQEHYQELGLVEINKTLDKEMEPGQVCPKCGMPTLISLEGCKTCQSCGYSSCE